MDVADEQAAVELGPTAPEAPVGQVEHETSPEAGDVGLTAQDGGHLTAQPLGAVPVVVVPVGHDLAPGQTAGLVAHHPDAAGALAGGDMADPGILGQRPGQPARAVLHDDQLGPGIVLAEEIGDGLAGELRSVPGGHDGADQGDGGRLGRWRQAGRPGPAPARAPARPRGRRADRGPGQRPLDGDEARRGEVLADLAPAVRLVVAGLAREPQAAEAVLVEPAGPVDPGLGRPPASRRRVPEGVGTPDPHPEEPGPGRPDVVVHLPARTEAVRLVGRADRLDDGTGHGQAEVGQAVQGLERAHGRSEASAGQGPRPGDVGRGGRGKHRLLVPRAVGGGPGQTPPGPAQCLDQAVETARGEHGPALHEHDDGGLGGPGEAVEAGRGAHRLVHGHPGQAGQDRVGRQGGDQRGVGSVGQEEYRDRRATGPLGPDRPHGLDQAGRVRVGVHPDHDVLGHGPTMARARYRSVTAPSPPGRDRAVMAP